MGENKERTFISYFEVSIAVFYSRSKRRLPDVIDDGSLNFK